LEKTLFYLLHLLIIVTTHLHHTAYGCETISKLRICVRFD